MTALLGFLLLGEKISPRGILGMLIVVGAIIWVILGKTDADAGTAIEKTAPTVHHHRVRGIIFAFFGALGQSGGLILSKIGAPHYDPLRATEIRVIAGLTGFIIMALILGRIAEPLRALSNRSAVKALSLGAFFGPFLGVSLGLFAVQRANTGVAATLMGLTPILIVFPSVLLYKEKLTLREVLGAGLAVFGLTLLFLS
jgi:drug/metabolite transporter (DMT)-like permease